jgi:hypothetical protein
MTTAPCAQKARREYPCCWRMNHPNDTHAVQDAVNITVDDKGKAGPRARHADGDSPPSLPTHQLHLHVRNAQTTLAQPPSSPSPRSGPACLGSQTFPSGSLDPDLSLSAIILRRTTFPQPCLLSTAESRFLSLRASLDPSLAHFVS